jgi:hypothetical protein
MHKAVKYLILAGALALIAPMGSSAYSYSHRQYYSSWHRHPTYSYHYRHYYYKPTPTYSGYKHHYVVYYPRKPQYVYYYNPYKKTYWGRCPTNAGGRPQYSLLDEKDRRATLDEIPERAFPKPGPMPPIPESDKANEPDGKPALVDLPPDDLPTDDALPR